MAGERELSNTLNAPNSLARAVFLNRLGYELKSRKLIKGVSNA